MRRSPIFSMGQVFQKSRPVSSRTFSSRVSASRAVVRAASSKVVSVIGITFRSSVRGLGEDADVPGTELERGARADLVAAEEVAERSGGGDGLRIPAPVVQHVEPAVGSGRGRDGDRGRQLPAG